MELSQPIVFEPLCMERVWGGRKLASLFGKHLPPGSPIGESWEIVDREDAQSVVHEGPLRGRTLNELWTGQREEIFGKKLASSAPRFPLLLKLLDAQDRLSVQVHPPAAVAEKLGGEPKTEMWFIADAQPAAEIFAGLKRGVTRDDFERALHEGTVAEKIHRILTNTGDAIFVPSGRIHAIGAGNVIVEVQQNSDTTYRVFDWNRVGLDGKPRALHVAESMESIDFGDIEPALATPRGDVLVECEYFRVEKWTLEKPRAACDADTFAIFTCLSGAVECGGRQFKPGDFFLVPAANAERELAPVEQPAVVLRTTIPA
jgi:mannose-6-phosphate isomerase